MMILQYGLSNMTLYNPIWISNIHYLFDTPPQLAPHDSATSELVYNQNPKQFANPKTQFPTHVKQIELKRLSRVHKHFQVRNLAA